MLCKSCLIWHILQQRQRRWRVWRLTPSGWSCTSWCCMTQWRAGGSGRADTTETTMSLARHARCFILHKLAQNDIHMSKSHCFQRTHDKALA